MTVKVQINDEGPDSYKTSKGVMVDRWTLTLIDASEGPRLSRMLQYSLNEEEIKSHKGKLRGKFADIAITNCEVGFGGQLQVRAGHIIKVY